MQDSKIEWCDHTFNPWIGCTKVSPGCVNCYAEAHDLRFAKGAHWGKGAPRKRTSTATWKQPLLWNRRAIANHFQEVRMRDGRVFRGTMQEMAALELPIDHLAFAGPTRPRVFCASLADWLDDEVPIEWLADMLGLVYECNNLVWQLLTKRPENWRRRMLAVSDLYRRERGRYSRGGQIADKWLGRGVRLEPVTPRPPHNVWIGTTVEDQPRADERIPALLKIPARVRFLSCEPLLGPVDLAYSCFNGTDSFGTMPGIHWVICGGESGPNARPMHPDWARSLRDQCAAAAVPFLFKQWGQWAPWVNEDHYTRGGEEKHPHLWVDGRTGEDGFCWIRDDDGDWQNWTGNPESIADGECHPAIAVMGRHGKKAAGRLLDGREHNEFPCVEGGAA